MPVRGLVSRCPRQPSIEEPTAVAGPSQPQVRREVSDAMHDGGMNSTYFFFGYGRLLFFISAAFWDITAAVLDITAEVLNAESARLSNTTPPARPPPRPPFWIFQSPPPPPTGLRVLV